MIGRGPFLRGLLLSGAKTPGGGHTAQRPRGPTEVHLQYCCFLFLSAPESLRQHTNIIFTLAAPSIPAGIQYSPALSSEKTMFSPGRW